MKNSTIPRDSHEFEVLQDIIRQAVKTHIEINGEWLIEKDYFSDEWKAEQLDAQVQERYEIKVSNRLIECDFAEDEDPESLTNCYVQFEAIGGLAKILRTYGCDVYLTTDSFNSTWGTDITFLSDEDVDVNFSLLTVKAEKQKDGLATELVCYKK
jgi:ribosomal protein S10